MKWGKRRDTDDLHDELARIKVHAREQIARANEENRRGRNHLSINHFGELLRESMRRRTA